MYINIFLLCIFDSFFCAFFWCFQGVCQAIQNWADRIAGFEQATGWNLETTCEQRPIFVRTSSPSLRRKRWTRIEQTQDLSRSFFQVFIIRIHSGWMITWIVCCATCSVGAPACRLADPEVPSLVVIPFLCTFFFLYRDFHDDIHAVTACVFHGFSWLPQRLPLVPHPGQRIYKSTSRKLIQDQPKSGVGLSWVTAERINDCTLIALLKGSDNEWQVFEVHVQQGQAEAAMGGPKETEHGRGGRHWKTGRKYKGRRCKWMQVANALSESYLDWLTLTRQRTLKRKRQETARKRGGRRDWENGQRDQETDRGSSLLHCSDTCDFFEPSIFWAPERSLFHLFMSKLCCKMRMCDFAAFWLTPPFVFTSH